MSEVSLQLFFEEKLKAQKELFEHRIKSLEQRLDDALEAIDEATKIQNVEWARRLADLNNTKKEMSEDRSIFLLRETYDRAERDNEEWKRKQEALRSEIVPRSEHELHWRDDIEFRRKSEEDRAHIRSTIVDREEFNAFKEDTQKTLLTAAGQSKGLAIAWGAIVTVVTVIISFLGAYLHR